MKRFLAAILLLLVTGLPRAGGAETLADALVSAYNHSGLLDQNRALLRAADEDVAAAQAALKPVLRWSGSVTRTFGTRQVSGSGFSSSVNGTSVDLGLIAELLLYDGGNSKLQIEATKETVLATRDTLINIEQQVLFRAVAAYMGVIEASESVALRNNNLRLLTQELRAARDRFEVGEVTRTDVALAEAQLAQARSGLAGAQGALLQATEEFRNVVGRAPGRLQPPPRLPDVGRDLNASKALAVRTHPSMRAAQHQVAAADLLVLAAEAAMQPTVTLRGQYGVTENFNSPSYSHTGSVGIDVGQTIYNGGRLSSNARRAMAQRDAQRANLHIVRHDVQQDVGNAYANLLSARAQLEASERQIRAARIAFRGVREEATLGARTTLDVLDAEQSLLDAQSTQVSARANLYIAAYNLLAATGRLTVADLKLPVQTYDPAAYYNLVKDGPAKRSKQGQQLDRVLRALQKD
ncbi:TolC family outer membrane protein [Sulfitobacter aestuariivivens]|uniref:TolC family outer membrane protein n=1 Tax=Sulfitobacter aestuariivivens TaxID=2766981 RepID=A0A927D2N6_9RHOB|nr:TolC family outer membrane protein [Sulfitobacter aestuariivivens]MBD3662789.1 TolC family outer membrane protein [Sulfitobacter aestuariivivens]